jgi:hypothetical protein
MIAARARRREDEGARENFSTDVIGKLSGASREAT